MGITSTTCPHFGLICSIADCDRLQHNAQVIYGQPALIETRHGDRRARECQTTLTSAEFNACKSDVPQRRTDCFFSIKLLICAKRTENKDQFTQS